VEKHPWKLILYVYATKNIYSILKTWWIISALFSTQYHLFHKFIFSCSYNIFFMNHVLKFNATPVKYRLMTGGASSPKTF
jgi:hypothetical protein